MNRTPPRHSAGVFSALCCLVVAVILAGSAHAAAPPQLVGAADGVWIIRKGSDAGDGPSRAIVWWPTGSSAGALPGALLEAAEINRVPIAMAAAEQHLYLVLDTAATDAPGSASPRLELYGLRAPASGLDAAPTRLSLIAALPDDAALVGLAANRLGPIVLMHRVKPPDTETENAALSSTQPVASSGPWRLLQRQGNTWQPLPLPEDLSTAVDSLRILPGGGEDHLMLLSGAGATMSLHRYAAGTWRAEEVASGSQPINDATIWRDQVVATREGQTEADPTEVVLLRAPQPIAVAPLPPRAVLVADSHSPLIVTQQRGEGSGETLTAQRLDVTTGEYSAPTTLTPAGWRLHPGFSTLYFFASLGVVLLAVPMVRRAAIQPVKHKPATLPRRGLALILDLLPGGLITAVVLGVDSVALLRLPAMWPALEQTIPWMMMGVITIIASTILELFNLTTPGHLAAGLRVISSDGARPDALAILRRNSAKLLTLLMPPLIIIAFLSPHMQPLHDLFSSTTAINPDTDAPADTNPTDST